MVAHANAVERSAMHLCGRCVGGGGLARDLQWALFGLKCVSMYEIKLVFTPLIIMVHAVAFRTVRNAFPPAPQLAELVGRQPQVFPHSVPPTPNRPSNHNHNHHSLKDRVLSGLSLLDPSVVARIE